MLALPAGASMRRDESTFLPAVLALPLTATPLWLAPTFFAWQVLAIAGRSQIIRPGTPNGGWR